MNFTQEQEEKIKQYLEMDRIDKILTKIGIYDFSATMVDKVEAVKTYISEDLMGKFRGDIATNKFLKSIEFYSNNNDFKRFHNDEYIPEGFIDYNIALGAKREKLNGFRMAGRICGPDGNQYIVKEAEGLKGDIAGKKNRRDGVYNPTVAYAFFKYLGQECAESIPACEKIPYYYTLSRDFLKPGQKMYSLEDDEFMKSTLEYDSNNNIKHSHIMNGIEESIKSTYGTSERTNEICKKLRLQYAVQETLKKLIKSMDENLGNTSIVITENEEGEMKDINISPAYDQDLSFLLGEEILGNGISNNIFYRTTDNGNVDLTSIINEFQEIPGYTEKLQEFVGRLQGNYIDQIINIAVESTGVPAFNRREIKDKFGSFIMRRVAEFKEIYNNLGKQRDENNLAKY